MYGSDGKSRRKRRNFIPIFYMYDYPPKLNTNYASFGFIVFPWCKLLSIFLLVLGPVFSTSIMCRSANWVEIKNQVDK